MLLSILTYLVTVVGSGVLLFLWWYRDRYFGTDNRHKWFAEYSKDFPIWHNEKTMAQKKRLFEPLHDLAKRKNGIRVLEIGAGSGANFQFYPKNTNLTVLDPNPFFRQYLLENLEKHPNVALKNCVVAGAENMTGIPDNSYDAVVSTMVLCSCLEVQEVYKEICRVLVPGGTFYFMEHVIDDKPFSFTKLGQKFLSGTGIFPFLLDGCRCDKDLENELRKSVFASVNTKRFPLDISEGVSLSFWPVHFAVPHMFGTATKAK